MADERDVMLALRAVIDPELGINVVDLGLVYAVRLPADASGRVEVDLAMTSAGCPLSGFLCGEAEQAVLDHVPGVTTVAVNVVDDPPWTPERMSDEARAILG